MGLFLSNDLQYNRIFVIREIGSNDSNFVQNVS